MLCYLVRNTVVFLYSNLCFRMEDTVRSMLQYKTKYEQLKQDKASLTIACEVSRPLFCCYVFFFHRVLFGIVFDAKFCENNEKSSRPSLRSANLDHVYVLCCHL